MVLMRVINFLRPSYGVPAHEKDIVTRVLDYLWMGAVILYLSCMALGFLFVVIAFAFYLMVTMPWVVLLALFAFSLF